MVVWWVQMPHGVILYCASTHHENQRAVFFVTSWLTRFATCEAADLHFDLPGQDVALFNGLLQYLATNLIPIPDLWKKHTGETGTSAGKQCFWSIHSSVVSERTGLYWKINALLKNLCNRKVVSLFSVEGNQSSRSEQSQPHYQLSFC
jgi:assimilatory nitrate reductase catalytic subunit